MAAPSEIGHNDPVSSADRRFVGIDGCHSLLGAAVVVDVMRAFTVAAWAFGRGATRIVFVDNTEDALELRSKIPGALALAGGAPPHGFDLANSPAQLLRLNVDGRVIIQRTSAGTRGALAARTAAPLLCCSFVCASATARRLRSLGSAPITYVVSGDNGMAEEDKACAEFIHALVCEDDVDPAPYLKRARNSPAALDLQAGVLRGYRGVDERDVEMCLEVDRFDFAMEACDEGGHLMLIPRRE